MDELQQEVENLYNRMKDTNDLSLMSTLIDKVRPLIKSQANRVANGNYQLYGDLIAEGLYYVVLLCNKPERLNCFGSMLRVWLMRGFRSYLLKRRTIPLTPLKLQKLEHVMPKIMSVMDSDVETRGRISEVEVEDFITTHLTDPVMLEIFQMKASNFTDREIAEIKAINPVEVHRLKTRAYDILRKHK